MADLNSNFKYLDAELLRLADNTPPHEFSERYKSALAELFRQAEALDNLNSH